MTKGRHGNPPPVILREGKSRTHIYPSKERQERITKILNELLIPRPGETQTDFAAAIGISVQLMTDLKRGRMPSLGVLFLICDELRLPPNVILGTWKEKKHGKD